VRPLSSVETDAVHEARQYRERAQITPLFPAELDIWQDLHHQFAAIWHLVSHEDLQAHVREREEDTLENNADRVDRQIQADRLTEGNSEDLQQC
jgi:hypothetical protein